jgi:phosphoglycolate phosphatase-like HAD superfamily hydrolase
MKTLLWDIDGTLLTTNGAGVAPFKRAIEAKKGTDIHFSREDYAGLTDHQIANLHLKHLSLSENYSEVLNGVVEAYVGGLEQVLVTNPAQPFPGIIPVLSQLSQDDKFQLAVVTGNCVRGAFAKLKSAKLFHFFKEENIFCSTGLHSRSEIVFRAIVNLKLSVGNAVVVGDTLRDVEGARECGLKSVILFHKEVAHWANSKDADVFHLGPSWSPNLFLETLKYV